MHSGSKFLAWVSFLITLKALKLSRKSYRRQVKVNPVVSKKKRDFERALSLNDVNACFSYLNLLVDF